MKLSPQSCFFFMIIIFPLILLDKSVEANEYDECRQLFLCGNVSLSYPFYDGQYRPAHCGYPGFEVNCSESSDEYDIPEILVTTTSEVYRVLRMDPVLHTVSVARKEFWSGCCPEILVNTTLNNTLYKYPETVVNITLYYLCPPPPPRSPAIQYYCKSINTTFPDGYFMINDNDDPSCQSNIVVPLNRSVEITDSTSLHRAFQSGYDLGWIAENDLCDNCRATSGECGYDSNQRRFTCYYNGMNPYSKSSELRGLNLY